MFYTLCFLIVFCVSDWAFISVLIHILEFDWQNQLQMMRLISSMQLRLIDYREGGGGGGGGGALLACMLVSFLCLPTSMNK